MKTYSIIVGFLFFFTSFGFTQNCPIINSIDFANDYATMPTATVKVNFHFLPINPDLARPDAPNLAHEYSMGDAQLLANALISYANQNFENLQHANSSQFYQSTTLPHVQKAKIKLELYDGGQGSIFLYSGLVNSTHYQTKYGQGNVLDIVITYENNCDNTGQRDYSLVTLCNFDQRILDNTVMQENRARLLCHEVGHVFNLEHTFQCTQCLSEIKSNIECGGNCSCSTPSIPSNNVMSYNGGNNEITPCQWAGIESQGNLTIDNSTIEHAVTAVSRQAGYFRATNTIFENNMRDIEYLNKPTFPITDIHKNCTFKVTNSYRGSIIRSRVTMWNSRGIFFNGCDFINQYSNPYQLSWNLQYDWQGIYAVGSGFEVNKNTDNNKKCTFTNFSTGIRVASIGTTEVVNILNAVFDQNDNGVISEAVPNIYIKDNKFNISWFNSFPHSSWYSTGLFINSGSGFTVNNNEFTGYGNSSGQYTFGTLISETGESDNLIEGNKYSNLYVGNRVLYKNTNSNSALPTGLKLYCGNHTGNVYDHTIEAYGNPNAGIRLKQGDAGDPDGNQFSNNSVGPDIWTDAPEPFERFYQESLPRSLALPDDPHVFRQTKSDFGAGASCNPFVMIMGAQPNIAPLSVASDSIYATELTDESVTGLINVFGTTDAALQTAKAQHGNLIDGGNPNSLLSNINSRWNRDTAALRINLLLQSPNLSTTALLAVVQLNVLKKQALMQIFLANPSACREPKFLRNLKQSLPNLLTDADIQQVQNAPNIRSKRYELEESINVNSSRRAEIGKLLVNHYLTHPETNKQQLRYWWERLGTRPAQYSLAESYITEPQSNRYEAALRNLNQDLAYSDTYIKENEDYIELYGIKSKILKSGRSLRQLNASEIESIRRIANNTRADAAVQANNILCMAIGECKQFEIPRFSANFGAGQGIIMNNAPTNSKIKENAFTVYPNPTSGSLTIDFDIQNPFTEGPVSLLDLTGKRILNQKISNGQRQVVWQTEQLNRGLYFIILTIDNQNIKQTKVSIQK